MLSLPLFDPKWRKQPPAEGGTRLFDVAAASFDDSLRRICLSFDANLFALFWRIRSDPSRCVSGFRIHLSSS